MIFLSRKDDKAVFCQVLVMKILAKVIAKSVGSTSTNPAASMASRSTIVK